MEAEQLGVLIAHFDDIEDPRRSHGRKHNLVDIILIAVLATIAGCDDWEEMEEFGQAREEWLKQFLELPNGIPSHDTIRRMFLLLKPAVVQRCFLDWLLEAGEEFEGEVIAIDGKTLRRSYDKGRAKEPLHIVNVWATRRNIILGQEAVAEKSNETTAIPKVLDSLDVSEAIVTCDAMGCQTDIAQKIREKDGNYLLALKGNQPTLHEDVKTLLEEKRKSGQTDFFESVEKDHGRIETRRCYVTDDIFILGAEKDWKDIRSVAMIESSRETAGKVSSETRYFISSLPADAKIVAGAVRDHWKIENTLHWSLDITFGEDSSRVRGINSAENLSFLRKFVLSLLKNEPTPKKSLKRKRLLASLKPDFLLTILAANASRYKLSNLHQK